MRRTALTILAFVLLAAPVHADGDAGFAGAFLRNGMGARPLGMGGAFTAIAEGPEATYYNPAGMGFKPELTVSMSYKTLSLDRHLGHVALSFPIRNEATMAASWVNAGVSDVNGRGESRQLIGAIRNSQNAFALSFAKAIDSSLAIGGNLKYVQEKLDILETFAVGVDLGLLFRFRNMIFAGVAIQNLGSSYRWDSSKYWTDGSTYEDKFPIVMKFGVAGNFLSNSLVPAIDLEKSSLMKLHFRAGAEYWLTRMIVKKIEDEYEEGKFIEVQQHVRWAGIRAGLDKGSLAFGASYIYFIKDKSIAIEYAFLAGRQGTSAGHIFTLKAGF
jgi:hypothetical protein